MEGRQYVVVLNDGNERGTPKGERPKDSTMLLVDARNQVRPFSSPWARRGSASAITKWASR
jgi:hypothetical protein